MNEKENPDVGILFAILDRFSRDRVYKTHGVIIDFIKEKNKFIEICSKLKNVDRLHRHELAFESYEPYLDYDGSLENIHPQYQGKLEKNSSKLAQMKKTLLQFAVSQPLPMSREERIGLKGIIKELSTICRHMITKLSIVEESENKEARPNKENRTGPSPLHIWITKTLKNEKQKRFKHRVLRIMLDNLNNYPGDIRILAVSTVSSDGKTGSIMRGGVILNIAARTLDPDLVKILVQAGVPLNAVNEQQDNIFHSLIRFANVYPEQEEHILQTMKSIVEMLERFTNGDGSSDIMHKETISTETIPKQSLSKFYSETIHHEVLWTMRSKDGMTPLQLAAKLGKYRLFEYIFGLDVYRVSERDRGYFDEEEIDITEIETVPLRKTVDDQVKKADEKEGIADVVGDHISVLHLLEMQPSEKNVFPFLSNRAIGRVISDKWEKYSWPFFVWGLVHFLLMGLYSWQVVVRTEREIPIRQQNTDTAAYDIFAFLLASNTLVLVYSLICFVFALFYYWYYVHKVRYSFVWFTYMHLFTLFFFLILTDYILIFIWNGYKNFIMPVVSIIGWYLFLYFLQIIEFFSVFTVLIQRVTINLIQFLSVMGILLFGFSVSMYSVLHGVEDIEEDSFDNIGKALFKMFTVMLGIGELGELFYARYPILAVILFVLFVLSTTILLLNALIAIMSNTCSDITEGVPRASYAHIQRLYVITHIEAILPTRWTKVAGEGKDIQNRLHPSQDNYRRFLSLTPDDENTLGDDGGSMFSDWHTGMFHKILKAVKVTKRGKGGKVAPVQNNRPTTIVETNTVDIYEMKHQAHILCFTLY